MTPKVSDQQSILTSMLGEFQNHLFWLKSKDYPSMSYEAVTSSFHCYNNCFDCRVG